MKSISPLVVTPADVLESPPEPSGVVAWNNSSHDTGDKVLYGDVIYECQADGVTDRPDLGLIQAPATYIVLQPSNKMAAFDDNANTEVLRDDGQPLVIRYQVNSTVEAVYLENVFGGGVTMRYRDALGNLVGEESPPMLDFSGKTSPWEYFYGEWESQRTFIFADMIPSGREIEIEIQPAGSVASIGTISSGKIVYLGKTGAHPEFGSTSFSNSDRNAFGDRDYTQRFSVPRDGWTTFLVGFEALSVRDYLLDLDKRRAVFIPSDEIEEMSIFGYVMDWSITSTLWEEENGLGGTATLSIEFEGFYNVQTR